VTGTKTQFSFDQSANRICHSNRLHGRCFAIEARISCLPVRLGLNDRAVYFGRHAIVMTATQCSDGCTGGMRCKPKNIFDRMSWIRRIQRIRTIPAFWAGASTWKVRYSSGEVGTHRWRAICSASDAGLDRSVGSVEVTPYTGNSPLFNNGPIRVAPDRRHFEHADGTPFFWLGDTWWMGLCHRLHFPDEFAQLAKDRVKKGFNVVQLVAGLYPDMHPFDPRGANEAGFPWEAEYAHIRPVYFDAADLRLWYLIEQGITPCIVGAWGYFLEWMGEEKMKAHWRNLIARYASWPVVWVAGGEANLPWYRAEGFPYDDQEAGRRTRQTERSTPLLLRRVKARHPAPARAAPQVPSRTLRPGGLLGVGRRGALSRPPR